MFLCPFMSFDKAREMGFFFSQVIPHGFFKFKGVEIFVEKLMIGWIRRCTCMLRPFFFFIVFPSPWHFVQTLVEEVTCWSFYLPDSFKALMSGKYSWEINDWYLLFIIKFIMWPWCKISMYIMNNHVMVRYIFLIIIIIIIIIIKW
jgi:hypothetical protein